MRVLRQISEPKNSARSLRYMLSECFSTLKSSWKERKLSRLPLRSLMKSYNFNMTWGICILDLEQRLVWWGAILGNAFGRWLLWGRTHPCSHLEEGNVGSVCPCGFHVERLIWKFSRSPNVKQSPFKCLHCMLNSTRLNVQHGAVM